MTQEQFQAIIDLIQGARNCKLYQYIQKHRPELKNFNRKNI